MITTLLFDFNNLLLFQSKATAESAATTLQEIEIPGAYSPLFYLNQELLEYIQGLKKKHSTVILSASEFTLDQPVIQQAVEPYFNRILLAKNFGWSKDNAATYLAAAKELQQQPQQIFFTDDKTSNVEAAQAAGLTTIHFENNAQFITKLEKVLAEQE